MTSNWIKSPLYDGLWILAPMLLPAIIIMSFPNWFVQQEQSISTCSWLVLVLLIDVAHVYSTLFKMYFVAQPTPERKLLLATVPICCAVIGILLYSSSELLFWRCLAYLAVFHFARQQYGFMRLYSRHDENKSSTQVYYKFFIYAFTIIPILIWHLEGPRKFNWFVENDFMYFPFEKAALFFKFSFKGVFLIYIAFELLQITKRAFNLPRCALLLGTALSWYVGIVLYDGDLSFTFLNIAAHGIPYMALVYSENHTDFSLGRFKISRGTWQRYGLILFICVIVSAAFIEEGLWDALVWREHANLFSVFYFLQQIDQHTFLSFAVPLLSLPQTTHYVLDGFIWKRKKSASPEEKTKIL
jgi:hypothetical protein